jgi:hypothetical protein
MRKAKAPFEATNYMLFYFAANAEDAAGKECDYVLNRSEMWDNTAVAGSSTSYEFVGLALSKLKMRALPCPCENCFNNMHAECTNRYIVSAFKEFTVSEIVTNCPDHLQLPLENNKLYTNRLLKAFMKKYNKRVPGSILKPALIQLIKEELSDYLLPAVL